MSIGILALVLGAVFVAIYLAGSACGYADYVPEKETKKIQYPFPKEI